MSKGLTALQPAKVASGAGAKALCYHFGESVRHVVLSSRAQRFTIKKQEAAKVRTTQAVRLFQYRVEDRREVARRGVDDLQDLGSCSLLFQRLPCSVMRRAFSIAITACAAKA